MVNFKLTINNYKFQICSIYIYFPILTNFVEFFYFNRLYIEYCTLYI